jgi:hypothetical protein
MIKFYFLSNTGTVNVKRYSMLTINVPGNYYAGNIWHFTAIDYLDCNCNFFCIPVLVFGIHEHL